MQLAGSRWEEMASIKHVNVLLLPVFRPPTSAGPHLGAEKDSVLSTGFGHEKKWTVA